jgi:hypothetical protein
MSSPLQKKLSDYAPQPPAQAWDVIEAALDSRAQEEMVAKKLAAFTATPPAGLWNSIEHRLDRRIGTTATVRTISRLLAAAVFIAAIVLAGNYFLKDNTNAVSTVQPPIAQPTVSNTEPGEQQPGNSTTMTDTREPGELRASVKNNSRIFKSPGRSTNVHTYAALAPGNKTASFVPKVAVARTTVTGATAEKYIVYSDDEGSAMRLSKKLFDFITCVKQNFLCRQQMAVMQNRFATTSLSTDFTGVLEIVRGLSENQ